MLQMHVVLGIWWKVHPPGTPLNYNSSTLENGEPPQIHPHNNTHVRKDHQQIELRLAQSKFPHVNKWLL